MSSNHKLRILYLSLEFSRWRRARQWSYATNLGLEEGLLACGVQVLTITTPWFSRAQEICAKKKFDQVWIEIVHNDLEETFLEWVASLSPIRIGMITESLTYSSDVHEKEPTLEERKHKVERRLKYMTHALVCDEKDVGYLKTSSRVLAMWWTPAVPKRFIKRQRKLASLPYGIFIGSVYGERSKIIQNPELKELMIHQQSPEHGTPYPFFFDKMHGALYHFLKSRLPGTKLLFLFYLHFLRAIRQRCFSLWLEALQNGCAVICLPHYVKTYTGRVVEGMAAHMPVITPDIPDRPRNRALFEDGVEILLYPENDPIYLANHIRRILSDPGFSQRIVEKACRKINNFHTCEKRVQQILNWVETGEEPVYA